MRGNPPSFTDLMLSNLFVWLVIIPFVLGFVTYGIQRFLKVAASTDEPKS